MLMNTGRGVEWGSDGSRSHRSGGGLPDIERAQGGPSAANEIDDRRELFGFIHEETFTSARQAADIRGRMTEFAARWNYRLTKIYTEKPGEEPKAFEALRAAVKRDGAVVVVPNAADLASYGSVLDLTRELEQASGVPVLQSEPKEKS